MRLNWFNYKFLSVDGYGRFGLGFVRALLRLGHEVHPYTIDALEQPTWFQRAQGIDFSHASVMLMPPHNMKHLAGRGFAYTMHESMKLPPGWADHVNQKSQWLIVPSPWLAEVFSSGGVKIPIEVVPGGIDPDECQLVTPRRSGPFTFGCLGDRGNRKGFDLVWMAFYKAFDVNNKDVRLLIKCRPGSMPANMDFSYGSDPRLVIWRADVDHVSDIYSHMSAFIFPTRCEGFGMPPREAAACGIPTVVTRWSGTADDADKWAVPLEKYKLVESHMKGSGGLWAQADLDELVWRMRDIYEHQDDYALRASKAADWMRDNATYTHSANKLVDVMGKYLGMPQRTNWKPKETKQPVHSNGHAKELA